MDLRFMTMRRVPSIPAVIGVLCTALLGACGARKAPVTQTQQSGLPPAIRYEDHLAAGWQYTNTLPFGWRRGIRLGGAEPGRWPLAIWWLGRGDLCFDLLRAPEGYARVRRQVGN